VFFHMKLTFPHVIGYITGALTFLSGLNPALVAALVGPAAAPYAVPIIAGAGAALVFLHDIGVIGSKVAPAVTSVAKMLPVLLAVSLAVTVSVSLSACATLATVDSTVSSPADQPFIQAGALAAVTTAEAKGISAAQINSIAKQALTADSGATATLAALAALVNGQLSKLNMPPAEGQAAAIVEDALEAAISAQVGSNTTLAATQAAAADVLQAIISATGG
jgi:hypothetical protein